MQPKVLTEVQAHLLRTVWALLLAATAGAAFAQNDRARAATPRSDAQWLRAMQTAAQRVNFSGTLVYQRGSEVRASRIVHFFDGTTSHERVQMLDGVPREFIRRGDEVQCIFPDARRVVIERRPGQESFPAISNADPAEILENYALRLGGTERVANVECQVIHVEPKDALRYGYKLWVDPVSGLLLKAQTLDGQQEVLEQMAFADVRIGERAERSQVKPSWSTEGWRVERSEHRAVDLAQLGWTVVPPAGFRKIREVARRFAAGANVDRSAMQAVYSDGLATVSVFIEPDATEAATEHAQSQGPTSAYSRRVAHANVTVVGEVPPATVKALAQAVEFRAQR
ncbi:MAG: MucB/RseB C-terminal domain-containing protein [Burkholderiaceae bacterium]